MKNNVKIANQLIKIAKSIVAQEKARCNKPGTCPKCESEDIEYGDTCIEDDSLGYKCTCNDCNTKFTEWYNLQYSDSVED